MASKKRDSAFVGLVKTRVSEDAPRVIPTNPVFRTLEPNSFPDASGNYVQTSRRPFNTGRQRKRGEIVDVDSTFGFNTDITLNNWLDELQDFCFANAREKFDNLPLNGVARTTNTITAASRTVSLNGGNITNPALRRGSLLLHSNFDLPLNNGLKTLLSIATNVLTYALGTVLASDVTAAKMDSRIQHVGHQFDAGEVSVALGTGIVQLVRGTGNFDFTTLGLIPGEWVFLGGDETLTRIGNNVGFARVSAVTATALNFDKTTFAGTATVDAANTLRMFFGPVIRNEPDEAMSVYRYQTFERLLATGPLGQEAEQFLGGVANEFTLNVPTAEKLNADFGYITCDVTDSTGETDDLPYSKRAGSVVVPAPAEKPFNGSNNLVRHQVTQIDPASSNPTGNFGLILQSSLSIGNNITPAKATSKFGAFAMTAGSFDVGGDIETYFIDIKAKRAIRKNSDCTYDLIAAKNNTGFVIDVPLMGINGGSLAIEMDAPIMLSVEPVVAQSKFGHSVLFNTFYYLPTVAMPL